MRRGPGRDGGSLAVVLANSHSVSLARHRNSVETGARHRDFHVAEAVASATKETRHVTRAIGSVVGMRRPMAIVDWQYYSFPGTLPDCRVDMRDLGCPAASPRRYTSARCSWLAAIANVDG